MKVILLEDIKGVGKKDQIINASDGYARNFLLPKNKAVEANAGNINKLNAKMDVIKRKKESEKHEAEEIVRKTKEIIVEIKAKCGQTGRIFGGITSKEISEELNKQYGINVDRKKIVIENPIKNLGTYTVKMKLYEGVVGNLKIKIVEEK